MMMTQDRVGAVEKKWLLWFFSRHLPGSAPELWGIKKVKEPKITPRFLA